MKIRLIESNKILAETENTNLIKVLNLRHSEIKIKRGNEYYIYHYENSSYNFDEDTLEVYLRQIDIEDVEDLESKINIERRIKSRIRTTRKYNRSEEGKQKQIQDIISKYIRNEDKL